MSTPTNAEQPMHNDLAANKNQQPGYLYRICPADANRLRSLISEIVGSSGWIFGGASVWDYDSNLDDPRKNLRTIVPTDPQSPPDVRGDFGHAFSQQAEVRWKRLTSDRYDILILTEGQPIASLAGCELPATGRLTTRVPHRNAWMVLQTPDDVQQRNQQWRLGYIEYVGENHAVRFVRYTQREERPV